MTKLIRKIISRMGYYLINKSDNPGIELIEDIKRFHHENEELLIFDVGANTGQSALSFAKSFPSSVIHSFEPTPQVFSLLEKSVKITKTFLRTTLPFRIKTEHYDLILPKQA